MDNRKGKRWEASLSAEVYTRSAVIPAGAKNLSEDGVCLAVAAELPEDEMVGVSMFKVDDGIEDPDAEPINLPARVVWTRRNDGTRVRTGIRFVDDD